MGEMSIASAPGIPEVPSTASVDDVLSLLREFGAVRVVKLVTDEFMDKVVSELMPSIDATQPGAEWLEHAAFLGHQTRRVSSLMARSRACGELAMHPLVLGVAKQVLENFQLHVTQAVCLMPGQERQPIHRDDLVYEIPHPMMDKEATLNTLWAASDYSAEIGATWAVPGSHKWDDERQPLENEGVQAVMPRGSVLLYYGSTYHGGGANQTKDRVRIAIALGYSRSWLRQEENQYLAVPPKIAKTLPEPLQRLIGYSLRQPYTGWVELKDPHTILEGDD